MKLLALLAPMFLVSIGSAMAVQLSLQLDRTPGSWVFLSEVEFLSSGTPVFPISYDMQNGEVGGLGLYGDSSYNGTGDVNVALASLSGGLGELTDGTIATQNWNGNKHPWLGWVTIDPTIVFQFAPGTSIDSVTVHVDDSQAGGVDVPAAAHISVDGGPVSDFLNLVDPPGIVPISFTFDLNPTHSTPDASSTIALLGLSLAGLIGGRRIARRKSEEK